MVLVIIMCREPITSQNKLVCWKWCVLVNRLHFTKYATLQYVHNWNCLHYSLYLETHQTYPFKHAYAHSHVHAPFPPPSLHGGTPTHPNTFLVCSWFVIHSVSYTLCGACCIHFHPLGSYNIILFLVKQRHPRTICLSCTGVSWKKQVKFLVLISVHTFPVNEVCLMMLNNIDNSLSAYTSSTAKTFSQRLFRRQSRSALCINWLCGD